MKETVAKVCGLRCKAEHLRPLSELDSLHFSLLLQGRILVLTFCSLHVLIRKAGH